MATCQVEITAEVMEKARLPFLVDLQGDVLDEAAFRRLTTPTRPAGRR